MAELADVLQRPKLAAVVSEPLALVLLIETASVLVEPVLRLSVVPDDPDNRVLEASQAGHADYIVTGDGGLLELDTFDGASIVQPSDFLQILDSGS